MMDDGGVDVPEVSAHRTTESQRNLSGVNPDQV